MNRKEILRIGAYVGLAFLFIILIITIFHFTKNKDDVVIDLTPDEIVEEEQFENLSNYSEAYIRDLVNGRKEGLQDAFMNIVLYKLNNEDEDTEDIVVSEQFLTNIKPYITNKLFQQIQDMLEEVTDTNIENVDFNVYKIDMNELKRINEHSAIAFENTGGYKLNLVKAEEERIEANIINSVCEKVCDKQETYKLILVLDEDNAWKIDEIY